MLARLIRETRRDIEAGGNPACYCVVMDGTGRLPTDYTGRLGVPRFEKLGEIVILRLSPGGGPVAPAGTCLVTKPELHEIQRSIRRPGFVATGGDRARRSRIGPLPLATPDRLAAGLLEDTRRGKRLFTDGGDELVSAHLSGFAYATPRAAAALLTGAVARAGAIGIPAVFAAIPRREWSGLLPWLGKLAVAPAPATIFGHGLEAGGDWWIDTAEI